jgi:hypothetical protein
MIRPTCEIYVMERWIFSVYEGAINTIVEYPEAYPAKHLLFSFDYMFLEEVELREMRPEEIRPYVEMLEAKLTELKKANIALKEQVGLRRRADGSIEQWR